MKTVKVSIQDENTLVLLEDGQKGDLIDLKSIHDTDIDKSTIDSLVKSLRNEDFKTQLESAKQNIGKEKEFEAKLKEKEIIDRAKEALTKKEQEILVLNTKIENISKQVESDAKIKSLEEKKELEDLYQKKISEKETEIQEIKHQKELNEQILKDKLTASETALVSLKEMRSRMSTKMIGESLEIHCENEFNKLKPLAFPNAQFGKDNQVSDSGSKGDYVYRELDDEGNEILSIMFEMKNEDDTTATKKKNKDFIGELDKDRREKKCEFAVLVSLLEKENEYYDDIVTVSDFPNMYAIRPQHFITIIGFLRQGNLKSQELRKTIFALKNQNIDVTNFENELLQFQDGFMKNVQDSSNKFQEAMDGIDATIKKLESIKEALRLSNKHLLTAGNKVESVSIKALTKDNPTMTAKFADLADTNMAIESKT
jgi:hypothetical protein